MCEFHDYGDPSAIPGDEFNGLQVRIDQCDALNKPLLVGELGIIPNDVGGTLQARADVLESKLSAQFAAGVDGALVWSWSSVGSLLNNFEVGPGDPVLDVLAATQGGGGGPTLQTSQVSAGFLHRARDDHRCRDVLGHNGTGGLGDGTTTNRTSPVHLVTRAAS